MVKPKTLIYIGDRFYFKSSTLIGVLYDLDGIRYDWGFVQRDLQNGKTLIIRPATASELDVYEQQLRCMNMSKGS